jgi:hypothetical protein
MLLLGACREFPAALIALDTAINRWLSSGVMSQPANNPTPKIPATIPLRIFISP